MNKLKGKEKTLVLTFVFSLICMVIFAASFLLMPIANGISLNEEKNSMLYAVGVTFWLSLFLALILSLATSLIRKKCPPKDNRLKKFPGAISFFSNKEATVADILAVIFIIAFVVCAFVMNGYLIYVFLFLAVLFFEAHCVLNGKNYQYIKELISGGKE